MFRGDRLRLIREERGLTREELTARLNIGANQLWKYEEDGVEPRANAIAAIASALEVTTDYLLGLVDAPDQNLTEEKLSPMERRLLSVVRQGMAIEAMEATMEIIKQRDNRDSTDHNKAIN